MRRCFFALIASGIVCSSGIAHAEKRVALVIGNSAYVHISRLTNPLNDAKLMADTLRGLGFTLVGGKEQLDLDKAGFDRVVQSFGTQLQGADVGLFYYAGHGVQVRGANYLVPVGANPTKEADVDFQMLDANLVLRQMESAGTRLNLVVLDACRNNPFGGRGLRSSASGLAQIQAPKGTLISFATQPGNVALDGNDRNSPYTKALAETMRRAGLDIFQTFNEVGLAVERATGGAQQPWVSSSPIAGRFFFAGAPAPVVAPPPGHAADEITWGFLKSTTDIAALRRFVTEFPASARKSEAQGRIAALEREIAEAQRKAEDERKKLAAVVPPMPSAPPTAVKPAVGVVAPASGVTPLSPTRERALKPKDRFKECDLCPEMIVVPAGSFLMGATKAEDKDAKPQRRVTIAKPFAVGRFALTVDEYSAFVSDTNHNTLSCTGSLNGAWALRPEFSFRNPGFAQTGSHPAVCVSWDDAKAYVAWLSRKTGKTYRLLSQAEHEYVTRAGTTTPFWWGSTITPQQANYDANYQFGGPKGEHRQKTVPVESFKPNPWGLYQVHGNIAERVEDCDDPNNRDVVPPTDGTPRKIVGCPQPIFRGGGWDIWPSNLRSWIVGYSSSPNGRSSTIGFRIARILEH